MKPMNRDLAVKAEIERLVDQFLVDFEAARFEGYHRFFVGPTLVLIMPGVGVMRGLDEYLEYESRSTKVSERQVSWEERTIDVFGNVARVTGLLTMSFAIGGERKQIREYVTFLLERQEENGWKCFHLQATLAG